MMFNMEPVIYSGNLYYRDGIPTPTGESFITDDGFEFLRVPHRVLRTAVVENGEALVKSAGTSVPVRDLKPGMYVNGERVKMIGVGKDKQFTAWTDDGTPIPLLDTVFVDGCVPVSPPKSFIPRSVDRGDLYVVNGKVHTVISTSVGGGMVLTARGQSTKYIRIPNDAEKLDRNLVDNWIDNTPIPLDPAALSRMLVQGRVEFFEVDPAGREELTIDGDVRSGTWRTVTGVRFNYDLRYYRIVDRDTFDFATMMDAIKNGRVSIRGFNVDFIEFDPDLSRPWTFGGGSQKHLASLTDSQVAAAEVFDVKVNPHNAEQMNYVLCID
jgi:hypothetical protein